MADYRDLLRRAIEALPENNGNARRQVYDKARSALRKQLDAIQPELPSREKTHHRLQLEECIREVEQEATERMLRGWTALDQEAFGSPTSVARRVDPDVEDDGDEGVAAAPAPEAAPAGQDLRHSAEAPAPGPEADEPDDVAVTDAAPEPEPEAVPEPAPDAADAPEAPPEAGIEDEAAAEPGPYVDADPEPEPEPEIAPAPEPDIDDTGDPVPGAVDRPSPSHADPANAVLAAAQDVPLPEDSEAAAVAAGPDENESPGDVAVSVDVMPEVAPADEAEAAPAGKPHMLSRFSSKVASFAPGKGNAQQARPAKAEPAMSAEREVELDTEPEADSGDGDADPQTAIDHAIAVLDREAGGDAALGDATLATADPDLADLDFARAEAEDGGSSSPALKIFLVLVLLLLAGAGGASWWAYREGYLDLSSLFGSGDAVVSEAAATADAAPDTAQIAPIEPATPTSTGTETVEVSRPGNTIATPDVVETPATGLEQANANTADTTDNALALADSGATATPTMDGGTGDTAGAGNTATPAADAAAAVAEPAPGEENKSEDRLPVAEASSEAAPVATGEAEAVPDVVNQQGSQSLLLEASDKANAGAVPYSGTVDWTRGVDELGQPTLQAEVNIPARNMSVSLIIRKNSDPSLPASHLIEIDFTVSDSFIGGGISRIAGILMKNEELVQGVPLVGASARVVGNDFLFALSASSQDITANSALLKSRKWMDLAIIYSTGKQAILTLEKDDAATTLFDSVLTAWNPALPATTEPAPAADTAPAGQ